MASTRVMTVKKRFVTDGVFAAELDDFLASELGSDGYSGVDIRKSISKLEIIIKATKTQNVIGDKGARIKEIKSLIMERFPHLAQTKVELFAERIGFRGLCAVAQAESLRYKLIGGLVVRRACYGILRFIMESGAKGCEVVVSGKLRAARAKSMKFLDGFMIHSGQPKNDFIDSSTKHVHLRQGVLGIKVKIMLPTSTDGKSGPTKPLPDYVSVNEPKPIVFPDHPKVTSALPQGEISAQVIQKPYDPSGSTSDDNVSPAAIEELSDMSGLLSTNT